MATYYTKDHEWIQIEGNNGTIGITEYAVQKLGDITFIELPDEDMEVEQHDELCTIESVKAASDIYAPVSGKVVEIHDELEDNPELVNKSPEKDGWILKMEISDPEETSSLLSREQYDEFVKGLEE